MPTRPRRALLPLLLSGLLVASACSTKSDDAASGSVDPGDGGDAAEVPTGPGVTDDTITLGVLTDQTGPFAAASRGIAQGRQLFWDQRNADGGVCGRSVEFEVVDHAYNAQNATTLYSDIEGRVLALDELLGSPMIAALLDRVEQDELLTMAVSFSSSLLSNPYIVVTGATYDVEMINAVEYLVDQGELAAGDTIGHIYLQGDFGENALAGSRHAADELGLELVAQEVTPTDADLTSQVTAIADAGAGVVLLTGVPDQVASAVSVAQANGLDLQFVGSNPTFSPALLSGTARQAMEETYRVVTSVAATDSTADGPPAVVDAYEAEFPEEPMNNFVTYGYAQGELMAQILDTACESGDLTRAGLLEAFQGVSDLDTDGLMSPMDFTQPGQSPAREVFVERPDSSVPGGLVTVEELFAGALAEAYQPGS